MGISAWFTKRRRDRRNAHYRQMANDHYRRTPNPEIKQDSGSDLVGPAILLGMMASDSDMTHSSDHGSGYAPSNNGPSHHDYSPSPDPSPSSSYDSSPSYDSGSYSSGGSDFGGGGGGGDF